LNTCDVCGAIFPEHWPQPVRCNHKRKEYKQRPPQLQRPPKPNAWVTIHSRYATAIESGQWNEAAERAWLTKEFVKQLPCNSCGEKWLSLSASIDLSTAERAFETTWQAHNIVSVEHVNPTKQAITYEHCRALYLQQPSMDDCCIAVTSLAPNRLERQTECLATWKRAGLTIFAVQSVGEVKAMRESYPQITTWCIGESNGPPTIKRMADVATTMQMPVLIVNSDIEIRGEQRVIRESIARGPLIGIRHNYQSQWWINDRELWGVDAFSFAPESARRLPSIDLRIGRPCWDYWLLDFYRDADVGWIADPLFFHRQHDTTWTAADWSENAAIVEREIGLKLTRDGTFRSQFPFSG
jgi:hypothetical protein